MRDSIQCAVLERAGEVPRAFPIKSASRSSLCFLGPQHLFRGPVKATFIVDTSVYEADVMVPTTGIYSEIKFFADTYNSPPKACSRCAGSGKSGFGGTCTYCRGSGCDYS